MARFNRKDFDELKACVYNSYFHDAEIESVQYTTTSTDLAVNAVNKFFGVKITITFHNVELAFAVQGNDFGCSKTIYSLSVEDDFAALKKYINKLDVNLNDFIYLLFETFSFSELHVVAKEVTIETVPISRTEGNSVY